MIFSFQEKVVTLQTQIEISTVMTPIEINAEIYRAMSVIAEDEALLRRVLKYVKKLAAQKQDSAQMTEEEFFARVDEAKQEIASGRGHSFGSIGDLDRHIRTL